jgi:transcription elongation GreA/GreB family factor
MSQLKEQLYLLCADYLKSREIEIKKLIEDAREAANNETKSSAGDKYETGREVMQQEIDLNLGRLNEVNKLKLALDRIPHDQKNETAQPGAVVHTSVGNYYIAISAGTLKIDGTTYFVISSAAPIGIQLAGKKAGDQFLFNGKQFIIKSVE